MQHNARIRSDSIFLSAALRLTNQFSEFYHNTTDTKQGLRHYVNQPLKSRVEATSSLLLTFWDCIAMLERLATDFDIHVLKNRHQSYLKVVCTHKCWRRLLILIAANTQFQKAHADECFPTRAEKGSSFQDLELNHPFPERHRECKINVGIESRCGHIIN